MSHEIETFADGTAAFVSARETPWHKLGTVTADALTAQDALTLAKLDWTVEKHPVKAVVHHDAQLTDDGVTAASDELVDVPGRYATVRRNPVTGAYEGLGTVGEDYTIVQNWENAEFLNALVDESGAHFETAGSLRGGRVVFISMKMPSGILVAGQDPIDLYLIASNSHDGSRAFTVQTTPVRVVCANTLRMSDGRVKSEIRRRHTRGVTGYVQEAREALQVTFDWASAFEAECSALYATPATVDDLTGKIVDKLWVPDDADKRSTRSANRTDKIVNLFQEAPTQDNGRGTAWAAYNAVTEYLDWESAARDDNSRAELIALGASDAKKRQAFALARAL